MQRVEVVDLSYWQSFLVYMLFNTPLNHRRGI